MREGAAGAAARLVIAPHAVVALLSRGVTAERATQHVTIEGDADLAFVVVDVAMPLLGRPAA